MGKINSGDAKKICCDYMDKAYCKGLIHALRLVNLYVPKQHIMIRDELEKRIKAAQ